MSQIAYTVAAILPDEAAAQEYARWLKDGHVQGVLEGGANSALVIRVQEPPTPVRIESRYLFPNRQAFDTYLAQYAPTLREDGLKRFPASRGIRFERSVAQVL